MKIYSAEYVVTQNDARDVIRGGAVAVDGAAVAMVGTADDVRAANPGAEEVRLGSAVILPGLVNGHAHVPMSAFRGYSDDKSLMDWLCKDIFPAEARLTREAVKTAALLSCAEMIRTGTTSFYDMYMLEDAVFEAAGECGMRALLGFSFSKFFPSLDAPDEDGFFAKLRRCTEAWRGHPLIRAALNPHAVYTTDERQLRRCREFADDTGVCIGIHMSETRTETEDCLRERGLRPIPYCEKCGLLGPDTTLYHMVDADSGDVSAVSRLGCAVVHNPVSNMKLASGTAPVMKFAAAGIPVGLGTDGPASNNSQNMFTDMRAAALIHKAAGLDPRQAPAGFVLDMATRGGAAALHMPGLGRLEAGGPADFAALDLDFPNMRPVHDIISTLVYSASGFENRLTVVAGRELYRDGEFLTLDYEKLLARIDEVGSRVRSGGKI